MSHLREKLKKREQGRQCERKRNKEKVFFKRVNWLKYEKEKRE
jgi:hypothetical protein